MHNLAKKIRERKTRMNKVYVDSKLLQKKLNTPIKTRLSSKI
jgi:hypothetical protein